MRKKVAKKIIAALVILVFLLIFAIQNYHQRSSVRVFFWKIERSPVSVIIFFSVLVGALIACIELIPPLIRYRQRALKAERRIALLKGGPERHMDTESTRVPRSPPVAEA
ncbi:MAG: LapA family protein [Candidatus Aureabacteria bacterium]|nr:LapA family protein [Candidatus Auribacterota bacterium]